MVERCRVGWCSRNANGVCDVLGKFIQRMDFAVSALEPPT